MRRNLLLITACILLEATNVQAADMWDVELPAEIMPAAAEDGFVEDAFDAAVNGVKVMLPYAENKVYRIYCQEGFLTDLILAPGEEIKYMAGADTARWSVSNINYGSLITQQHVLVKPLARGLETDLIITTTRHVYHLYMRSGSFHNPMVEWLYPETKAQMAARNEARNYLAINPSELNFNYKFSRTDLPWAPEKVFDDGKKTYIKMKPELSNYAAPAFAIIENGNIKLANHRLVKGYYVIDRLFEEAQLATGKEKIKIKRKN